MTSQKKVLTLDSINKNIKNVEYAVRGELAVLAETLKEQLQHDPSKFKLFNKIINCNIGNPQQLGQKPITFFRQVAALMEYPELLEKDESKNLFFKSSMERARFYIKNLGCSIGAYSHSQGIPFIRKRIAEFLKRRDEYESDMNNIFLTTGASSGVQQMLQLIIQHPQCGIMIPIPQYPLYSATVSLFNGSAVPYSLNEKKGWVCTISDLQAALEKAESKNIQTRALVIINPGNPTGQCLDEGCMFEIIKFCYKEKLVLMADEVYQTNVYGNTQFTSFKKALCKIGAPYATGLELVSFHSISKGVLGECGRRGGYFELFNFDQEIRDQIYKVCSVNLCPNVQGQLMVDMMLNPPKQGEDSYELYNKEVNEIYESLKRRSLKLCKAFNQMENITCNYADGALYLFPRIKLTEKAIEEASKQKKQPDNYYCLRMLSETGVCMVPGSGFGQEKNTYHFRATFLPQEYLMDDFIDKLKKFHSKFMEEHKS